MEQSPSSEANSSTARREILHILWNMKVPCWSRGSVLSIYFSIYLMFFIPKCYINTTCQLIKQHFILYTVLSGQYSVQYVKLSVVLLTDILYLYVVNIVTVLQAGWSGAWILVRARDFSLLHKCTEWLLGPPSLPLSGFRDFLGVKLPGLFGLTFPFCMCVCARGLAHLVYLQERKKHFNKCERM